LKAAIGYSWFLMRTIKVFVDGCQCFQRSDKRTLSNKEFAMHSVAMLDINTVTGVVHYSPAVSIIMPFEPKMSLKSELTQSLERAVNKVELELMENYPGDLSLLVMQKLKTIIRNLNFHTHKKSIAVYVSPVFEKVLYLDIAVEEKIIVDESFEIRDLVYSKKQLHKFLILLLSSTESRMYLGNSDTFIKIVSNTPEPVSVCVKKAPEEVTVFSDNPEGNEIVLHRFLQHIDNALGIILNAYPLPLFVLGNEKTLTGFKTIAKHKVSVIEYIEGEFEEAEVQDLKEIVAPFILDWKNVMQKDLLNRLEEAAAKNKLAVGMQDVWREAMGHKGRLLVLEKDYMYAAQYMDSGVPINQAILPYSKFSYLKDAVDDVIEKVLEHGGDVEFVDRNVLKDYKHIALVQH
jgi:hypothetical protein